MLLLISLGIPSASSQAQAEETLLPEASQTIQPSETPWLTESGTAMPGLPEFTETPVSITPASLPGDPETFAPRLSDESLRGEFVSGEVILRFRNRASKTSIEQCIESVHASITSEIDGLNTLVLSVPDGRVAESLYHLQSCSDIRYAEPNYTMHIADVYPSDPGWGNQYGLVNIRAPQGWEMDTGSASVTIAIVDTGIDRTHPDLAGKLVPGIDIANGDNNPQDDHGHGTHVAGIAAALSDNGTGVAGVSWGARLMPVKVLDDAGNGSYADVADGIIWAADHGAQIINLSVGGSSPSQTLQDAVDYAAAAGVIIVAAVGNGGSSSVMYPAGYPNVIAVGATDSSNTRAGLSNYGPEIDLSAPGIAIYSTVPGGYAYRNGTSMAAPFVSGLASILLGIPGNGSPAAVTGQMQSTALDLGAAGRDDYYGHGLIQMDAALRLVLGNPIHPSPTPVPPGSLPGASGGFVQLPTLTPPATDTPLPTPTETVPASPALIPTDTPAPTFPDTPEVIALETEIPAESEPANWFLPGCSLTLILLGLLLFWLASRQRRKKRRIFTHFR